MKFPGSSRPRRSHTPRRVLVVPRLGDPLWAEGRARLIWAANTAESWCRMGFKGCLLGSLRSDPALRMRPSEPEFISPGEHFRAFYGVSSDIEICLPPFHWWQRLLARGSSFAGPWGGVRPLAKVILPHFDILHTRDFRLAHEAVLAGVPVVYEDHNELQNRSNLRADRSIFLRPEFRLAAGSTERVRDRLIRSGVPLSRTCVAHSGLNERSLEAVPAEQWQTLRSRFLGRGQTHLLAYAGGLHSWRGIRFLRRLAQDHPHFAVVALGGNAPLSQQLRKEAIAEGLPNLHVLGYRPQREIPAYLQAADALLLPYQDPSEAYVTSPLKFFEYLAAGRPIAAARLPELSAFENEPGLAIEWCAINDYDGFARSVHAALAASAEDRAGLASLHREIARHYTWEQRQRRLCLAAGFRVAPDAEIPAWEPAGVPAGPGGTFLQPTTLRR